MSNEYIVVNTNKNDTTVWSTIASTYTPSAGEVCVMVPTTANALEGPKEDFKNIPIGIRIGDGKTVFKDLPILTDISTIRPDWDETDTSSPNYIWHKPITNSDLISVSDKKVLEITDNEIRQSLENISIFHNDEYCRIKKLEGNNVPLHPYDFLVEEDNTWGHYDIQLNEAINYESKYFYKNNILLKQDFLQTISLTDLETYLFNIIATIIDKKEITYENLFSTILLLITDLSEINNNFSDIIYKYNNKYYQQKTLASNELDELKSLTKHRAVIRIIGLISYELAKYFLQHTGHIEFDNINKIVANLINAEKALKEQFIKEIYNEVISPNNNNQIQKYVSQSNVPYYEINNEIIFDIKTKSLYMKKNRLQHLYDTAHNVQMITETIQGSDNNPIFKLQLPDSITNKLLAINISLDNNLILKSDIVGNFIKEANWPDKKINNSESSEEFIQTLINSHVVTIVPNDYVIYESTEPISKSIEIHGIPYYILNSKSDVSFWAEGSTKEKIFLETNNTLSGNQNDINETDSNRLKINGNIIVQQKNGTLLITSNVISGIQIDEKEELELKQYKELIERKELKIELINNQELKKELTYLEDYIINYEENIIIFADPIDLNAYNLKIYIPSKQIKINLTPVFNEDSSVIFNFPDSSIEITKIVCRRAAYDLKLISGIEETESSPDFFTAYVKVRTDNTIYLQLNQAAGNAVVYFKKLFTPNFSIQNKEIILETPITGKATVTYTFEKINKGFILIRFYYKTRKLDERYIQQLKTDWDQNDVTQHDYIYNRPIYKKDNQVILEEPYDTFFNNKIEEYVEDHDEKVNQTYGSMLEWYKNYFKYLTEIHDKTWDNFSQGNNKKIIDTIDTLINKIKDLSNVEVIHIGKNKPEQTTTQLWINTNDNNGNGLLYYKYDNQWIPISAMWTSSPEIDKE